MSQMKMGGIINGIKRSKTHQRLEVRAMESGCRYLSYTVTQPERKSAGNRMIEQFIDKSWNMVFLYHFTYPEGSEDPETQSLRITKDFSALRESLRQFKAIITHRLLKTDMVRNICCATLVIIRCFRISYESI
jgi:hypothetical protein